MTRRKKVVVFRPTGGWAMYAVPPVTVTMHLWVPDDTHPLGGTEKPTKLRRRVNIRKDELPSWLRSRPLYEYVRDQA